MAVSLALHGKVWWHGVGRPKFTSVSVVEATELMAALVCMTKVLGMVFWGWWPIRQKFVLCELLRGSGTDL